MASLSRRAFERFSIIAALAAALALSAPATRAADDAIFSPGEPIVTGFSGTMVPDAVPDGSDPLDYTLIDPAGPSMVILQPQPDGPPAGQLIESPSVFSATAADVGQVFGVTLDNAPELSGAAAPNIYLSATSAFGLNITVPDPDGNPVRSKLGAPDASFAAGQWGAADGAEGYPGSIWKIDGTTGEITLFSTIAANSGAGLGAIVYDPASAQFFVSDLDTGLIYRLSADGEIIDSFDHGVNGRPTHELEPVEDDGSEMSVTDPAFNSEDPGTWGFTQPDRKVYALAINGGRLFYTAGPQVWSVRINADGSFGTARWELDANGIAAENDITSMLFDPQGRMILAQRGPQQASYDYSVFAEPDTSAVVRYEREFPDDPATPGTWVEEPETYAIGFGADGTAASGGIALGPKYDEDSNSFSGACSAYLWSTGDSLRDSADVDNPLDPPAQVHGLQGNLASLVRPQNDPPTHSFFTDYDGNTDDDQAALKGHVGAVAVWQVCEGSPETYVAPPAMPPFGYTPPPYNPPDEDEPQEPEYGNLTLEKWASPYFCFEDATDFWCNYTIRVENTGDVAYWGPVVIDDHLPANNPGAAMSFWPQPPWSCGAIGPTAYQCATGPVLLYPGDGVVLHEVVKLPKAMVDYCSLANVASINWIWGGDDDPSDDFDVGVAGLKAPGCFGGGGTDLLLDKIAAPTCVDAGADWNCSYVLLVQNAGPGNFTGPIQVQDTLGLNAPATVLGPWSCLQAGPVLTCNINAPPVNVPPGWTSGFLVTAHVPKNVGPPLCSLDNKANISAPAAVSPMNLIAGNDNDSVTAPIPDPACIGPTPDTDLEIQKSAMGCTPYFYGVNGYLCEWQVTLTNIGTNPYNGPLTLVDTTAGTTANELTFVYPFCTGGPGIVTCTPPGSVTLNPGVPGTLTFHTFYPDGPDACSVTNNIEIAFPNPGSPQNPGGNDSATTGQPLPNPACFVPGAPKLNIQKTATGCASDPSSPDWLCEFDITVFNYGGGPQPGPVQVTDYNDKPTTFTGAACAPSGVNQWLCTRPAAIPSLGAWNFHATTRVDPTGVTLADCAVTNTVLITNPASADPGYLAQASQKVPQLFINVGPGPVAVYCDPPSLKLTKEAVKTVKAGDGYDATFVVRATSTGPDPYIGTVEVDEDLPDGTTFVSSNWTCVPTIGNDMHCSSPPKTMPVGKYTQMTIVIHIPSDVAVKAQCEVVNTANVAISAEVLHSPEGVQYTASAAAQLPADACRPPPPAKQCPAKQTKPDGSCCEDGTLWNGKQCAKPRPETPKCPDDSHLNKAGQCVCDADTHGTPGKCKPDIQTPVCPRDSKLRDGECVCLPDTHGTPGKCKPDIQTPVCPRDSHLNKAGQCVCDEDTHGTPGKCKPDIETPVCPKDSRLIDGECVCLPDTHGTPGKCKPDEPEQPICPEDSRLRRGQCICLPGTHGNPGFCQADEVEQPSCPDDSHLSRGQCVCNAPLIGKPGNCQEQVIITEPEPKSCPDDSHYDTRRKACICNKPLVGKPGECTGQILQLDTPKLQLRAPTIQ